MRTPVHIKKLNIRYTYWWLLIIAAMLAGKQSPAQPGFGTGNVNPSAIQNCMPFDNNICPADGSYTILRRVPVTNCFNGEWINLSHDANTAVQNTGLYIWMLDYTDVSGRRVSLKGTSVLIRK